MAEIKPIETFYKGYRFRSRLEARWAVFFDAMGIRYEYEYEGYERSFGAHEPTIRYLPDFYLPDYNIHAEVKGVSTWGELSEEDASKMYWMIDFDGPLSNGVVMLGNIPDPYSRGEYAYDIHYAFWKNDHKSICYGYLWELYPDPLSFEELWSDGAYGWINPQNDFVLTHVSYASPTRTKLSDALCKARQARFEHGETPTTASNR